MGPEGGCAVSHVFLNAWGFESPDFVKWAMCISQTAVFGVSGPSFRKSNFSVLNSPIFSFRRKNTALSCGVFAVYLFCQHILEVTPGFEPGNEGFADPCLTTWLCHRTISPLVSILYRRAFVKHETAFPAHFFCRPPQKKRRPAERRTPRIALTAAPAAPPAAPAVPRRRCRCRGCAPPDSSGSYRPAAPRPAHRHGTRRCRTAHG